MRTISPGELTSFTYPSLRVQTNTYDSGRRETLVTGSYQSAGTTYATLNGNDGSQVAYGYFPNGGVQYMGLGPNKLPQQYCQNTLLQITGVRLGTAGGSTTSNCSNGTGPDILNLALTFGSPNNGNLASEQIAKNDSTHANHSGLSSIARGERSGTVNAAGSSR